MIHRNILSLTVIFVLILSACSPAAQTATTMPENAEQSPAATPPQLTEEQAQITAAATEALESPTPEVELSPTPEQPRTVTMQELITNTLALRSVKMSLQTIYADGKAIQHSVEVDQQGNYSLAKTYTGLPQGYPDELGEPPAETLLVVVDGTAYGPDNDGKLVKAEAGLVTLLENLLRGASGPGMWLSVLPPGSLTIAGQESKGGFETTKYSLQGNIEGNVITGEIWVEQQTKALVAADLVVPGALLGSPEQPAPGNLEIHFLVEAAEVAPVTAGESGDASQPSEETPDAAAGDAPSVLAHYTLDPNTLGGMNLVAIDGQIWVLTRVGDLLVFDADTGEQVDSLLLHPERSDPSNLQAYLSGSLAYDGKYLWALLISSFMPAEPRELLRIDPLSGEVLFVALPALDVTCDTAGCGWQALGTSPGKLWVSGENTIWVLDVETRALLGMITETASTGYLAYDGQGKMWGSLQFMHGFLMAINVDDLEDVRTADCIGCSWVLPLGELVWAGVDSDPGQLLAYQAADFDGSSQPVITVDLENEVNGVIGGNRVFFDGRYIWDKTSLADTLYWYDPADGRLAGSLTVYTAPGEAWNQYDSITAFTFDGKQLWAVGWTGGAYELLRIEIPWVD